MRIHGFGCGGHREGGVHGMERLVSGDQYAQLGDLRLKRGLVGEVSNRPRKSGDGGANRGPSVTPLRLV